jgi:hypothetical protein
MPPECEAIRDRQPTLSELLLGPWAQQCKEHDGREQAVRDHLRTTMNVSTRGQYMDRQSDHQETGRPDMCGLKIAVTAPELRTKPCSGRHSKKEQNEQSKDPGVLVAGGSRLEMLYDPGIRAER